MAATPGTDDQHTTMMSNAIFNRWLPALTLGLWGGIILAYSLDGRVNNVLAYEFSIYANIAAVLLILFAIVFVVFPTDLNCCQDSACSHALYRSKIGRLCTFGLILLPIALSPLGSKAALDELLGKNRVSTDDYQKVSGNIKKDFEKRLAARNNAQETAIENARPKETANLAIVENGKVGGPLALPLPTQDGLPPPLPEPEPEVKDWLQRTPEGYIVAEVLDLLYAAQDNSLRPDFDGKKVQLIGQFMPDKSQGPTGVRFKAVRMFMACCAADARPVATLAEAETMPDIKEMEWVKITGTSTFPIEKGKRVSILKAEKVEKTSPPADAMLQ
jgi:uncharacterized repeat protein (TIGR03943 family)